MRWWNVAKAIGLLVTSLSSVATAAETTPFAQRDSIELPRIANLNGSLVSRPGSEVALFSPDRRQFIVRVWWGDIARDENVERLLLFQTESVEKALSRHQRPGQFAPRVIAEYRFRDEAGQMTNLHWINDRQLGFTAKREGVSVQGYSLAIDSGAITRLTDADGDVLSFGVAGGTTVYFAAARRADSMPTVVAGNGRSIGELFENWTKGDAARQLYMRDSAGTRLIEAPPANRAINPYDGIWLSPDGRYALTLGAATDAPLKWSRYQTSSPEKRWTAAAVRSDPLDPDLGLRLRFMLTDLNMGHARPLFDAPAGVANYTITAPQAIWISDTKVIVVNSYLPLADGSSEIPFVAEVDINTGSITPIRPVPFATTETLATTGLAHQISSITWDTETQSLSVVISGANSVEAREQWVHSPAGGWSRSQTHSASGSLPVIERRETPAERPKLHASGGDCRCTRVIYDAAPTADRFSFGRQEVVRWKDSTGRAWSGGLVYPVGYVPGRKYSLILQTHGYHEGEFLIDGYHNATSAFAAQALANAGFLVLQDAAPGFSMGADEVEQHLDGYKSAIDALAARGLADRSRVGIIGFSRTGLYVAHLLAKYPDLVKAATIADAVQLNYTGYLMSANLHLEIYRDDFRRLTGGFPAEIDLPKWFRANPFYGMAKSNAAVRVEANGNAATLMGMWESYASIALTGGAADIVWFPKGSHILMKPSERIASQGGNVDWFRFWLLDQEDADPAKFEQYRHWRALRDARTKHGERNDNTRR